MSHSIVFLSLFRGKGSHLPFSYVCNIHEMLSRNCSQRSSLKRPNLPGADRLRFPEDSAHDTTDDDVTVGKVSSFTLDRSEVGTLQTTTLTRKRNPSRRPNLPICRLTSRVLNNTNLELSADFVEPYVRGDVDDTGRLNEHCRNYVIGVTSSAGKASKSNDVVTGRQMDSGASSPTCSTDDSMDSGPSEDTIM